MHRVWTACPAFRVNCATTGEAKTNVYVNVNLRYICPPAAITRGPGSMTANTHTISELAQEFGVTTRTIRFYEEKGLISPMREGQKRLYSNSDRVRIKLILRGKRIGMTLQECVDFIDMYDPEHNNAEQLRSLIDNVKRRRESLLQQKRDIDDMLAGLDEVQSLCEESLAGGKTRNNTPNPETH